MEFTKHFRQMLDERSIHEEWVDRAIRKPDRIECPGDNTNHFIKQIPENDNRWLRIVVNVDVQPNRAITAFFDRRLRRNQNENQS
ncbi:MAG: DUF4258 domain-containing protein [Deltaproteobacteria bacterium]|nr:DUF4258 domain-containing protein [Deltaproteobacteria bacterium]